MSFSINAFISQMEQSLDSFRPRNDSADSFITDCSECVTSASNAIDEISSRKNSVDYTLFELKKSLEKNEDICNNYTQECDSLDLDINSTRKDVSSCLQSISEHNDKIKDVINDAQLWQDSAKKAALEAETEANRAEGECERLRIHIRALQEDARITKEQIEEESRRINLLKSNLSEDESENENIRNKLADTETRVEELKARYNKINTDIKDNRQKLNSVFYAFKHFKSEKARLLEQVSIAENAERIANDAAKINENAKIQADEASINTDNANSLNGSIIVSLQNIAEDINNLTDASLKQDDNLQEVTYQIKSTESVVSDTYYIKEEIENANSAAKQLLCDFTNESEYSLDILKKLKRFECKIFLKKA